MVKKRNRTLLPPATQPCAKAESQRESASEVSAPAPAPPAPEVSAAGPAPGDWPASTTPKRDEKKARSLGIISADKGTSFSQITLAPENFQDMSDDNLEERSSSIPVESHTEENVDPDDEENDPANPEAFSLDPRSFAGDTSDTAEPNHNDHADRAAFVDAAAEKANVQPSKRSSGGFADEDDLSRIIGKNFERNIGRSARKLQISIFRMTEGKGEPAGPKVGPDNGAARPWHGAPPWGPQPSRLLFFAYAFVRKPKPQRCRITLHREHREIFLSAGRNAREIPLPGGRDAIAIVIELDNISIIIIIIIISTIYTAITTAAPRHRCIAMNEVRKKLFTISLSGKAAHWYKLLKNGDSLDWEDIVPLFYSKFYPPSEIHKDRNRIYNFWPHDGESIAQAWGRLKSLMLKCPIHELPGNVIIDNFYARLSFQDKTLLDTSCSGSFTRNKEEFKRDLLDRIQENTEGWENDKDRESGIIYDYKCIEAFMDTDKFRNMSATYGLDSQVAANLYKAFASHYELPKKNFDKYHEPVSAIPYELYTEIMHEIDSCELEDIDVVIQLANRETISPIGIVRDVEVLCDCKKEKILTKFAGESYEFNFSKFTKTPYKADLPSDDFKMEQCASIVLVPNNPLQQHLENSESEAFRKERDDLEEIFLRQPILKHDLPVEDLGTTPPPKEDPVFDLKPLPDNLKYAHIDDKKIYPVIISSKLSEIEEERWVSPVHCVPKKGGMTVVPNDNDELIPQRVVVGLENIAYDPVPVNDSFPNEQLAVIKVSSRESPCTMVSNNKDKGPLEEDIQDPELKEEGASEDEEEVEEVPRVHQRATIASIGVISNPSNTKRSARIATGGAVPRHYLAPRTSSPGNYRPFRNLIYDRQTEKTPKVVLPSGWDIDRSNIAGEMKSEAEGWGNNSRSWDSPPDMIMSRVEHNSELIRNLTYEIEDLKELVKKLVEKNPSHHHRRSNSSSVLASPWFVPSLGECRGITSSLPLSFTIK
ncbi:hypothetical protein QYE76_064314 [Lolium multiflorum]|uniref:Retrotransposon gag domain-containing protein n=1 Tax=Lolium multiflorum TaxID=4521 RepID=A0AAD8S769_LOLMU|nr:hypothetical protein QYE76_064314 [Lolium multiflorum]